MMDVRELKDWLDTLGEHDGVYVDEGGLILRSAESGAYIEIGGDTDGDEATD